MADYTVSAKITGDASSFQKAFESAQKTAEKVGQSIQKAGAKLTAASVAFAGIASVGVKYNATMETYQTSFEVMTGSADKAADTVERLKDIAASTPFEMPNLADTTQLLMNYGFTADEALDRMQMLGDIAQGSADKMNRIATAYGQMSSAGKVSLEDVKQMIEAGFNPLQEISETTGESMASLYERISDGTISIDEITASMQRSTSEGGKYFQSMEKQSQTFSGQLSTLKDNAQGLLGNLTEGVFEKLAQDILPKINEVVSSVNDAFEQGGLQGAIDAIKEISPVLDTVISKVESVAGKLNEFGIDPMMFAGAVAAAGPLLLVFGKLVSFTGVAMGGVASISQGIGQFAASMRLAGSSGTVLSGVLTTMSSPIVILVGAIAAAAAAFAYLMATNESFRTSILGTFSAVSATLMPVIQQVGTALMELGQTILSALGSVLQALAPAIAQLIDLVGQIMIALVPVISQLVTALVPVLQQIITMAAEILVAFMPLITALISQIMPVVQQIIALVAQLFIQLTPLIQQLVSMLMPIIQQLVAVVMQVISAVLPVIISLIGQLMPLISQIVSMIGSLLSIIIPLISQLISQLMPVISSIMSAIADVVSTLLPPLISIIEAIMGVIEALMPPIMQIIDVVVDVISSVMTAVSPIISFIAEIIGKIIEVITPIIQFVAEVIGAVISVVSPLLEFFGTIFGAIFEVVADIMGAIGEFIGGIFEGVKGAWNGLTGFVDGVFDGISSAFDALVGVVKGVINGVIGAINGAIWVINLIPGVEIGTIPYLLHGTEDWQGGFARMNEGGRGELTYLPNGAQVIPHDISVKYAKEAARANVQQAESVLFMIDYDRLAAAMTNVRLTPVVALDGEKVSRELGPYTDAEMGNRARQTARGMI